TVSSIDPVWGEGIHNCMKSGRAAAVTVDEALTPDDPDTSAEALGKYEERWDEEVGPERDSRMMVTELMYLMSNERYDAFVEQMDRMDTEALRRLNEGDKATILRMMSVRDIGLIGRWREMKAREAEPDTKAEEAFRAAERRVGSLMDRVFSKG
ncbi:MAG: hypothetical protein SV760_00735, partial [Halobacteria archaeon]|nr:hypothetical protein [Halobacteria archaeon]